MKAFFISLLVVSVYSLTAQSDRSYNVENFDELRISGPYSVTLRKGQPLVELSGDGRIIEETTVKIDNGRLTVKLERDSWKRRGDDRVEVLIQFQQLEGLEIGGASKFYGEDEIETDKMELSVSGASTADLRISSQRINLDLSGASTLQLSGFTEEQNLDISGASTFQARDFKSKVVYIDSSGASNASFYVSEELKGSASGASSVGYYGRPRYVDCDASGAASVRSKG